MALWRVVSDRIRQAYSSRNSIQILLKERPSSTRRELRTGAKSSAIYECLAEY